MGIARHRYTDEFKREAVGLLASSGRPLSQIAGDRTSTIVFPFPLDWIREFKKKEPG